MLLDFFVLVKPFILVTVKFMNILAGRLVCTYTSKWNILILKNVNTKRLVRGYNLAITYIGNWNHHVIHINFFSRYWLIGWFIGWLIDWWLTPLSALFCFFMIIRFFNEWMESECLERTISFCKNGFKSNRPQAGF